MHLNRPSSHILSSAILAIGLMAGSISIAHSASSTIKACVVKASSAVKIRTSGKCSSGERAVSWAIQGPAGNSGFGYIPLIDDNGDPVTDVMGMDFSDVANTGPIVVRLIDDGIWRFSVDTGALIEDPFGLGPAYYSNADCTGDMYLRLGDGGDAETYSPYFRSNIDTPAGLVDVQVTSADYNETAAVGSFWDGTACSTDLPTVAYYFDVAEVMPPEDLAGPLVFVQ